MFHPDAHMPSLLLPWFVLLGACGDPSAFDQGPIVSTEAAVVGGWAATHDQIFATVEIRRLGAKSGFCSGALISPALVATAAHCAVVESEPGVVIPATPGSLRVVAGHLSSASADVSMVRSVIEVHVHDDYDHDFIMGRSRSGAGKGGIGSPNDIALFVLSAPFEDIPNAPLLPAEQADALTGHGDVGYVAGYGIYDIEQKLAGELYISDAIIDILGPKELLTRRTDQFGDSCFGDSGGPFYLPTDYGDFLVGLVSRGRSDVGRDCGDGGAYTLLSAHLDWIQTAAGEYFAPRVLPEATSIAFLPEGAEAYVAPPNASLNRIRGCSSSRGRTDAPLTAMVSLLALVLVQRRRLLP